MPTNARITSTGPWTELPPLAQWLAAEDEIRGRCRLIEKAIEPGHMGGIVEAIGVGLNGTGAAVVLIRSLFGWLRQRQAGATLRLTLKNDAGRELGLEIDGVRDANAVITEVLGFYHDGQ